jgi:hypothetical protein
MQRGQVLIMLAISHRGRLIAVWVLFHPLRYPGACTDCTLQVCLGSVVHARVWQE